MHSLKILYIDNQFIKKIFFANEEKKIIRLGKHTQSSTLRQRILCEERIYNQLENQIEKIIEEKKLFP